MPDDSTALTAGYLRAILDYDPETGIFTWRRRPGSFDNRRVARRAGSPRANGYRSIRIDGRGYYEHRLAWLYVTGAWPTGGHIDHANRDKTDNRFDNLRIASTSQNLCNRGARPDNKSGLKGVACIRGRWWTATIYFSKKRHYLGCFSTPEAAAAAYAAAAPVHHGEFARIA